MVEGLVTLTVAIVAGFGLSLFILYRRKVRELRRERVPGVSIRVSRPGMASLALLTGGVWVCLCGGILVGIYAGLPSYVVGVGIACLLGFAQPLLAKGFHPFVISPGDGGTGALGAAGGRDDGAVYAEHRAALARGEERVLRWTVTDELHSYAKDEHVAPGDDPQKLGSLWLGIPVAAIYFLFSFVPALGFVAVLIQGGQPKWLLAVIAVGVGVVGRPAFVFCRDD